MTNPAGDRPIRFGVFQINLPARELRKHGVKVRLSGQPFTILEMLLEKPGQVVTRDELQKRIWPADTFVDFEQGLNGAIKKLRDALGDSPDAHRYIETLPKIGYRFIAPVGEEPQKTEPIQPQDLSAPSLDVGSSRSTESPKRALYSRPAFHFGVLAVVLLATVAAAVVHFRRPLSLFHDKDTIVIGSFENFSSESVFDNALRQALVIGMQQSPYVQVLSDHRSAEILRQMGHGPEDRLTSKLAIELCQRTGSKALVQGAVHNLGASYVLDLSVLRCDNSESIAQEQVVAGRKEDVIDALGQATARIRAKLGESLPSIAKYNAPLEQATTSSLEALKAYGLGAGRWDSEGDRIAKPYFERAVELDPHFAMALGALAAIHENDGEHELAKQFATKAYQNRDRATGIEKLLIESWYDIYVIGDTEKAAQVYEIGLRDYPGDTRALNDLGVIDAALGNYRKGAEIFREVIRLDPSSATTYGNLATCLMASNQPDEAGKVLDEADKRQLSFEYLSQVHYWLTFLRRDSSAMKRLLEQSAEHPSERALLLGEEAQTEGYFGKLQNARQNMNAAANLLLHDGDKETAATIFAQGAARAAEFGEVAETRELVSKALRIARGQDVLALVAVASACIGDVALAEKFSAELNSNYPTNTQVQKYWLPLIRAQLELRRGNATKAIDALEITTPYEMAAPSALSVGTLYPAYVRGEARLQEGAGAKAAAEFQKLLDHPGMVLNCPLGALARLGLARSLVQAGQQAQARVEYQALFKQWQDADSGLALIKAAKSEYAKLL